MRALSSASCRRKSSLSACRASRRSLSSKMKVWELANAWASQIVFHHTGKRCVCGSLLQSVQLDACTLALESVLSMHACLDGAGTFCRSRISSERFRSSHSSSWSCLRGAMQASRRSKISCLSCSKSSALV